MDKTNVIFVTLEEKELQELVEVSLRWSGDGTPTECVIAGVFNKRLRINGQIRTGKVLLMEDGHAIFLSQLQRKGMKTLACDYSGKVLPLTDQFKNSGEFLNEFIAYCNPGNGQYRTFRELNDHYKGKTIFVRAYDATRVDPSDAQHPLSGQFYNFGLSAEEEHPKAGMWKSLVEGPERVWTQNN